MVFESESGYGGYVNSVGIFIHFFSQEIIGGGGLLKREGRGEDK
jgi:hypothetical protein